MAVYNHQNWGKRGDILPDKDGDVWLTIDDIYERLGKKVPMDSIRQWIRSGRLKAYRPGKAYLIRREDFEKFMRESQTGQDQDKD